MDRIEVGLDDDQIMQRYLARRIFREIEFRIVQTDGTGIIGYVTGFDRRCIQVSTSPAHLADEPRSVLIFWSAVSRIEETGKRIDDLEHEYRSRIRSYSYALRSQCEAMLNRSRKRDGAL